LYAPSRYDMSTMRERGGRLGLWQEEITEKSLCLRDEREGERGGRDRKQTVTSENGAIKRTS